MYNDRKPPKTTKNIKSNESDSSKYKTNCSCPNKVQFENDQSMCDENNSWKKIIEDSEKLLQSELRKYGLSPRRHGGREHVSLKDVLKHKAMKVNIKGIVCGTNRYKAKTDPNLLTDKYVQDLKKEIKSKKKEIPSLPDEYKNKYIKSLKKELLLNKLTSHHDDNHQVNELMKEIDSYRALYPPFVSAHLNSYLENCCSATKSNLTSPRGDKERIISPGYGPSMETQMKELRKAESSEAGDGFDRISRPKSRNHKCREPPHNIERDDHDLKTEHSEVEIFATNLVKNFATIGTQYELVQNIHNVVSMDVVKKLDEIHNLIPQISSVIEKSEQKLDQLFQNVPAPAKTVHERAISPIKEIIGTSVLEKMKPKDHQISCPKTPPNSPIREHEESIEEVSAKQPELSGSKIGDLLVNIQNIKDSRYLLNGFQKELLQLRKDIENCRSCKERLGGAMVDNYCEKHVIYIPLLKIGEMGSKSDQINLFNFLKTEVHLKKKLENQIKYISKLERKLARAKKAHDSVKMESIQKELKTAKSYHENLLVKQNNERLLTEQQKLMNEKTGHECKDSEKCDKCCLQRQIHHLLEKLRSLIAKDIDDSTPRLKIQKMPPIDLRNSLQVQNILKLDIPPSTPLITRSNLVYEAIVKDIESKKQTEATQTKLLVNKTTSAEISYTGQSIEKKDEKNDLDSLGMKRNSTDSETTNDVNEKLQKKFGKTPSELGLRYNVATQCDSNSSLADHQFRNPKPSAHTQTTISRDESNYLFGFKEYLLKKTGDEGSNISPNLVDVNLQVSLEDSLNISDIFVEKQTVGVNTEQKSRKNSEIPDILQERPSDDQVINLWEDSGNLFEGIKANGDDINDFQSSLTRLSIRRSIQRTPSLKKMFLPSDENAGNQHSDLGASIQNPYQEPKYRMKRFSVTKQESDLDIKASSGDMFYKSLITKEELPERKTTTFSEVPFLESFKEPSLVQTVSEEQDQEDQQDQNTGSSVEDVKVEEMDIKLTNNAIPKRENFQLENSVDSVLKSSVENLFQHLEDVEEIEEDQIQLHSIQNVNDLVIEQNNSNDLEKQQTGGVEKEEVEDDEASITAIVETDLDKIDEPGSDVVDVEGQAYESTVSTRQQSKDDDEETFDIPAKTVLSLLSPKYKLVLTRRKDLKDKSEKNIMLRIPMLKSGESSKMVETLEKHGEKSDKLFLEVGENRFESNKISEFFDRNNFEPWPKRDTTNITNYILHEPSLEKSSTCRVNKNKVSEQRSEYAKKCSKACKSIDSSSIGSSEGEVLCSCKNISNGELHSCGPKRLQPKCKKSGIDFKEKLSSHLTLDRERRHYQHWVTYYATKKPENESCSSSLPSDTK